MFIVINWLKLPQEIDNYAANKYILSILMNIVYNRNINQSDKKLNSFSRQYLWNISWGKYFICSDILLNTIFRVNTKFSVHSERLSSIFIFQLDGNANLGNIISIECEEFSSKSYECFSFTILILLLIT